VICPHYKDVSVYDCKDCSEGLPSPETQEELTRLRAQLDGMRGERDAEREIAQGWERKYEAAREQAISVRKRDGVDGVVCLICDAWANADYNLVHVPRCALR
jgi:hypothetical protein